MISGSRVTADEPDCADAVPPVGRHPARINATERRTTETRRGDLLIFDDEIDRGAGKAAEPTAPAVPVNLDTLVAVARTQRPRDVVQVVYWPPDEPHVVQIVMGKATDPDVATASVKFDARTGAVLREEPDLETGFTALMLRLHASLLAGLPGTVFLGGMGLLFVAALVSGAAVYGPFMRKLPFGTVRRERAARLRWLDLHNLLGIVTLVWALVVGITGAALALTAPVLDYWQRTELVALTGTYRGRPPPTSLVSVQAVAETARAVEPDMALGSIAFPGTLFAGRHHYAVLMRGDTPLTARLVKPLLIDAQTGTLTAAHALPWYVTALLVSQLLHFGDYGGLPLKILWAVLDVVTILVLVSGLYLWGKRRKAVIEDLAHTLGVGAPSSATERRSQV